MENVQIAKRLSLLEEQKNLLIESAKTQGWIDDDSTSLEYDDRENFESEKLSVVNMVNAEETILEQQSLSTMEFRVHHLEKSIFGFDPIAKKALAYEKLKEQYSLQKRVDELKKEFNAIIMERDGADDEQTSELVSPFKDSALAMERVILTPEAKAEIVISSANELKLVAENLKQINELQSIIEAPEFKDQSSKANEVSARITQLLDSYNGIVNTLSEIFISWDHILSAIDANVSLLERAKG
ncbi:17070_t:CDS:2 [Funneliformis geosporum]|uniref:17070_t:CDS:1 n=1 Tax=Funneliformis geosporum TaxID=1117311 RepID=A0A9W4SXZ3_9GLOM|nr:17070_t:CDS:2 [Funneliformis geosporum]